MPDAAMFGRLLVYLGYLWQAVKSDEERGGRFNLGAVVVNLTGTGTASREMRWPGTPLVTYLGVAERNLSGESADALLTALEGGRWSRALLPWVPLMTGGGDAGIIDRWKALAGAEPDRRRKGDYAVLAETFAEKAGRESIWKKALEGWNVTESKVLNRYMDQARVEQAAAGVVAVLEAKFKGVPAEVEAAVRACTDLARLQTWTIQAATAATLADFRAAAGL